jgi:DNA-binding SARP family transcriptional activator
VMRGLGLSALKSTETSRFGTPYGLVTPAEPPWFSGGWRGASVGTTVVSPFAHGLLALYRSQVRCALVTGPARISGSAETGTGDMGELRFGVLGRLVVQRDGVPITLPVKQRALLAALLLRPCEPIRVRELGRSIWAEEPPRHLRAAVQTLVSRLPTALGDNGERIRNVQGDYAIQVSHGQLDLLQFRQLTAAAEAVRGQDDEAELRLLRSALEIWDGDPLSDVESETLALNAVPALVESHLAVQDRRLELELSLGRHARLLPELRALIVHHPYQERLWAHLIRALHSSGRQAEALSAYRTVDRLLADELGIRPGAELRELHRSILLAGDCDDLPVPGDIERSSGWIVHDRIPLESEFAGRVDLIDAPMTRRCGTRPAAPQACRSGHVDCSARLACTARTRLRRSACRCDERRRPDPAFPRNRCAR